MKVYFANDLFNDADRMFNMHTVGRIRNEIGGDIVVYNPMENDEINDKDSFADAQMVADGSAYYIYD